ncbi:DUF3862 domain-containing protein [Aciduricibacillus chroicocephali]|uniref:DUF3862 domain-containing protein n=1 Tax=Aciduricibacillus chroicocephali TaxID=3054939 RepID=A0ABY9KWS8_9BACI|nr:DUF3862 domain-containing protein [Bacillaceae bacterium 44XB]
MNGNTLYKKNWFWLFALAGILILLKITVNSTDQEDTPPDSVLEEAQDSDDETSEKVIYPEQPKDDVIGYESQEEQKPLIVHQDDVTPVPKGKIDDKAFLESVRVTKKKFNRFKEGMTYKEIKKIAGTGGEMDSKDEYSGTVRYKFPTMTYASSVYLEFQDDKLIEKRQYNLDNFAVMTLKDFNEIKDGMSYKEVTKILGGEGKSYTGPDQDDEYKTIVYNYQGARTDQPANVMLIFQKDRLVNKEQTGLD